MENIQDQEVFLLMALGIIIMLVLAAAIVFYYYRSQRLLLLQKVATQEQLVEQTIIVQEKERSRIAKDLHDDIGSKLNIIFLHLQRLKKDNSQRKPIDNAVELITESINEVIATTRSIAKDLIPPALEEFGFIDALKELCNNYNKTEKVQIQFKQTSNKVHTLARLVELNLFRILQELISNSIKHGDATQIRIHFVSDLRQIQIFYQDNGKGFNPNKIKNSAGLGMKNIESRLRIINGHWDFKSQLQKGLQAHLTLNPNLSPHATHLFNHS